MQPLVLTIPGKFWDSYIYRGRLYLFCMDGRICTLNWDKLIFSFTIPQELLLPLEYAFCRNDYPYRSMARRIFDDSEMRSLLRTKFARLADHSLLVSEKEFQDAKIGEQDNRCLFPHSDCEIYNQVLYTSAPSGVVRAGVSGRTKFPISTRTEKKWDAPVNDMSAAWGTLALAAGDEGLFELEANGYAYWDPFEREFDEIRRITPQHCTTCHWAFHSIFGSTADGGFLASFNKEDSRNREAQRRVFDRVLTTEELWERSGYAWGVQDKFCLATDNAIHVLRYRPWEKNPNERICTIGTSRRAEGEGQVCSASSTNFGSIVELDDALVIYPSAGNPIVLNGEPVNWRVFPRATYYKNLLHIVREDSLQVVSFAHDYLVDQESKIFGISVFGRALG